MTLSVFFALLLGLIVFQAVAALGFVLVGVKSWKAELTNQRPVKMLLVAMAVIALELFLLARLSSAAVWSPRSEAAVEAAYGRGIVSAPVPLDAKILGAMDDAFLACVLDDYARDPRQASAWVLAGAPLPPASRQAIAKAREKCIEQMRTDITLLDDAKQTKYSTAFKHALVLLNSPLMPSRKLNEVDQKSMATFFELRQYGMMETIRKGARAAANPTPTPNAKPGDKPKPPAAPRAGE